MARGQTHIGNGTFYGKARGRRQAAPGSSPRQGEYEGVASYWVVDDVDELELLLLFGQLSFVVEDELDFELEVAVGVALVAANAWVTPSAPVTTPVASPTASAARRMVDAISITSFPLSTAQHTRRTWQGDVRGLGTARE
jgi:hypothetical protein